jgi:hypothetical protein
MRKASGPEEGSWEPGAPIAWWERWSVLRLLRHDRWFVRLIIAVVLVGMLLMAGWVRWIPGSPWPDGRPWRLNGVGWLKCRWHDVRMGRPGSTDFRANGVKWLWRVEQDPANGVALRGYLDSLIADVSLRGPTVTNGLRWGAWLWRVGGTNQEDVRRMFQLAARVEDDGQVLSELSPWLPMLSSGDRAHWVLALAEQGQWDQVGRYVGDVSGSTGSELAQVVGLAWRAGWGPPAGAMEALRSLESAGASGLEKGVVADRLLIQVHGRRSDFEAATRVLARLKAAGGVRSVDRLRVARVAMDNGRASGMKDQIVSWAQPTESREVLQWYGLLQRLGDSGGANRMLTAALGKWNRVEWYLILADGLVEAGDWVGLRETGKRLREGQSGQPGWERVGWRLEAVANEKMGRTGEAAEAWRLGEGGAPDQEGMGWEWGRRLLGWGFGRQAADWILQSESLMGGRTDYWSARVRLGHAMGDAEALLEATLRMRLLDPMSPAGANDHAAALLILRRDPVEALRLVRLETVRASGGVAPRINEALALVQMGELNAGEAILSALALGPLSAMERTMVCLGRFEVHARRGRVEAAMQMYRAIEGRFLMSVQSRWLEAEYHRLRTVQEADLGQPRVRTP